MMEVKLRKEKVVSADIPHPVGLALVLCDSVYKDSSGKRALVGLFNVISAYKFPATHPRMVVYVSVTDIRPNTSLKLDIVHGETDEPVFHATGPAPEEHGPTAIFDYVFEIEGIVFTEPGTYFVRFWGNDYPLLQRPIQVVHIKSDEDENVEELDEKDGD